MAWTLEPGESHKFAQASNAQITNYRWSFSDEKYGCPTGDKRFWLYETHAEDYDG